MKEKRESVRIMYMNQFRDVSDEELARRIQRGDHSLFAQIIRRYEAPLIRYISTFTPDKLTVAEVVQETFITSFTHLNSFDTRRTFSPWIYRIAHNTAMSMFRHRRHETPWAAMHDVRTQPSVEEVAISREEVAALHACLHRMPPQYAAPLELFYLEELSYEAISDVLHIPMGTVATRIHRAKLLLHTLCQKK